MENTYLPCWEIPPVSGDPSRIGRSLAGRDPLPLRGAGSLHARDLPLRSGSPSTVVISLHGRYVFFHTSLASLKYYPNKRCLYNQQGRVNGRDTLFNYSYVETQVDGIIFVVKKHSLAFFRALCNKSCQTLAPAPANGANDPWRRASMRGQKAVCHANRCAFYASSPSPPLQKRFTATQR